MECIFLDTAPQLALVIATWPVWKPPDKVSSRILVPLRFLNLGLEFDTMQPSSWYFSYRKKTTILNTTTTNSDLLFRENGQEPPQTSMDIQSPDWMLTSQYWSAHMTSSSSHGVWPRYLNIWISDLDNGIQSMFIQFTDVIQEKSI